MARASHRTEFDLAKAWADSTHTPAQVYRTWRALYKAYGCARRQFPDVDWISLIAILDVIAMARASRRRVDISYVAEEMGWARTTALRRLQRYAGSGYLSLTREGRHTFVDNTRESRRAVLRMIDVLIDSMKRIESHGQLEGALGVDRLDRARAPASARIHATHRPISLEKPVSSRSHPGRSSA